MIIGIPAQTTAHVAEELDYGDIYWDKGPELVVMVP